MPHFQLNLIGCLGRESIQIKDFKCEDTVGRLVEKIKSAIKDQLNDEDNKYKVEKVVFSGVNIIRQGATDMDDKLCDIGITLDKNIFGPLTAVYVNRKESLSHEDERRWSALQPASNAVTNEVVQAPYPYTSDVLPPFDLTQI